jgi:hypothetical protein
MSYDTSKYNNFDKVPATVNPSQFLEFKRQFINACYMEGSEIMAHLHDDADIPPPANAPNPHAANPNSHEYRVYESIMAERHRDYKAFISRKKKLITIIHQRLPPSIALRLDSDPEFHRIRVKNAVYIMGLLKVDTFREYLENQVFPQPEWPPYHTLYNTLLLYQDNKKHIKETLHGKISVNATYEDDPSPIYTILLLNP